MITYSRDSHENIPPSAVKIIGLGGAGANMLERIALDSMEGAELIALNTDIRTLEASLSKDKIQLGVNLTKGLGTGGDPELGQQAMLEAEDEVRAALKGQRIVFLCTGLGGGTGSGAAPIIARIAREEGAFVVVFATMPFFFEGRRRREQAETSLNQLAVLSNALVTFDNNRMGELVLAKQGIHEAFAAADQMISESIKAVIRLVIRPGLINVGLDDLMSALRTTRSRCLFGSGIADGKDRASKALRNALSSPLLDQGSLLNDAQTVLVHLSGGESLTLFEIELLMQNLQKHVPEHAHVLFGAAIDPAMGDNLSITLISALPEDALTGSPQETISTSSKTIEDFDSSLQPEETIVSPFKSTPKAEEEVVEEIDLPTEPFEEIFIDADEPEEDFAEPESSDDSEKADDELDLPIAEKDEDLTGSSEEEEEDEPENSPAKKEERPFAEPEPSKEPAQPSDEEPSLDAAFVETPSKTSAIPTKPKSRPENKKIWDGEKGKRSDADNQEDPFEQDLSDEESESTKTERPKTQLRLDSKIPGSQSELSFDTAPRGRFEGEDPNVVDGEDLDLPPFLRKKKS